MRLRKAGQLPVLPVLQLLMILTGLLVAFLYSSKSLSGPRLATAASTCVTTANEQKDVDKGTKQVLLIPDSPDRTIGEALKKSIIISDSESQERHPLSNCNVSAQVQLTVSTNHVNDKEEWILQALDEQGSPKRIGGDEFYISYHHYGSNSNYSTQEHHKFPNSTDVNDRNNQWTQGQHPTAVATLQDNNDGTYVISFSTTPLQPKLPHNLLSGGGLLTVHFVYTCGIGSLPPPAKSAWPTGGNSGTMYTKQLAKAPPIQPFKPPPSPLDLGAFHKVVFVGDSTMEHFHSHNKQKFHSNVVGTGNLGRALTLANLPHFQQAIQKHVDKEPNKTNIALVVGSSVWDVLEADPKQGPHFWNHRAALYELVTWIRQTYPSLQFCWKGPSAVHAHVLFRRSKWFPNLQKGLQRIKYVSTARIQELQQAQKQIIEDDFHACYLDVQTSYQLSADWHFPGDSRHFRPELNQQILHYFYPTVAEPVVIDYSYTY